MKHKIALLGLGTVGLGTYQLIEKNAEIIRENTGAEVEVKYALVKNADKKRPVPSEVLTTDFEKIVNDPEIELVAEAMGGTDPALSYALAVLKAGKGYVTANKELTSKQWEELEQAAEKTGAALYFEASVAGAVPVIKAVTDSLSANHITGVMGIINGTTNYILSKMSEEGMDYADALKQEQDLGYAEPDPKNDVEGYDVQFKLAILASLAFNKRVKVDNILREGITKVSADDIRTAKELGYGIKMLAIGKQVGDEVEVRVHPTMIPLDHPLNSVSGPFNAVYADTDAAGQLMFYGRGAGDFPTASALLSDVLTALTEDKHRRYGFLKNEQAKVMDDFTSSYFIHTEATDKPNVLASAAKILGEKGVSIAAVMQRGQEKDGRVPLVFITHQTTEKALMSAVKEIEATEYFTIRNIIRVER